jgi:hypothetical protein
MYTNAAAAPRTDISTLLEEAVEVEKLFIGQKVMPIYESDEENGRYPKFKLRDGALLKRQSTTRNQSGTYNEVDRKFDWETYLTKEFGLEERIDDVVEKRFAKFFDAETLTAKLVMRALMIDYEIAVATKIQTPIGTDPLEGFTSTNSTVAYTEANILTFDFPLDLTNAQAAMEALGEVANTLILSRALFNRIRRSKNLQLFLFGSLSANAGNRAITEQLLAETFGFENIFVTKMSYDVAAKGKGPTLSAIWSPNYYWLGSVQGGDFSTGGSGRTIIWEADSPGGLFATETYRAEHRRGNMVRVRSNRSLKVINQNAGYLVNTQWA